MAVRHMKLPLLCKYNQNYMVKVSGLFASENPGKF